MGKKIKNPIEVRAVVHFDENGSHTDQALVRYTLSCEHEIDERKEMELLQSPEIQNSIKDLAEEGMRQIDIYEGIAEGDSLLV